MNLTYHMSPREINRVITAVNSRKTAEAAGLQTESERELYGNIWKEAQCLWEEYGTWPVFELCELD